MSCHSDLGAEAHAAQQGVLWDGGEEVPDEGAFSRSANTLAM
uniref:Uncharacterized protein n=1 Tax=Arundo donax TaxID=35708 RepID=A0A0A9ERB9_ARUDO